MLLFIKYNVDIAEYVVSWELNPIINSGRRLQFSIKHFVSLTINTCYLNEGRNNAVSIMKHSYMLFNHLIMQVSDSLQTQFKYV